MIEREAARPETHHELFMSPDEMLAPETLSVLLETPITTVESAPFKTADSLSGGSFLTVTTNGGLGPRLVMKRFSYASDWVMRATADHRGRAALVWETGLLDLLPSEIVHGYLASAREGTGWAILMHDMSPFLVPPGDSPITENDNQYLLRAMSVLHATFWDRAHLVDVNLGFSQLEADYTALTPATGRREAGGDDPVPQLLLKGWDVLLNSVDAVLAGVLSRLADDPSPLCAALRAFPQTVVHADWKLGNLGLISGSPARVLLLDWARVLAAPSVVDLAWYLGVNSARLPVSREETIDFYRRCLESDMGRRFDDRQWQRQIDLSLLGCFLQLGWSKALGAMRGSTDDVRLREAAELTWWCDAILPAIEHL
jgi:hypothetical protein